MIAVIAFGGNALLRPEDRGTQEEQLARADTAARWFVPLLDKGYCLVIVHGNGPQVGNLMIQMEAASNQIPPSPVHMCDAMTEGSMGYLLEQSIHNALLKEGKKVRSTTLLTPVVVSSADPAFQKPTKPVGPYYTKFRAHQLMEDMDWQMVEDAGRGWRKVVPSPRPSRVLNIDVIRRNLKDLDVVVAGGGGGIPVVLKPDGTWEGVEAVIDKDYTASFIARELKADLFIILTGVPRVCEHFGTPRERPLSRLSVNEARKMLDSGQFPPGSMGPKIRAAIQFVEQAKTSVLITSSESLMEAMEGKDGTYIV